MTYGGWGCQVAPGTMNLLAEASRLASEGDFDGAIEVLDRAAAVEEQRIQAYWMKGAMLSQLGNHEDAARAYAEVLAIDPAHPMAWYSLGCAFREMGMIEPAL